MTRVAAIDLGTHNCRLIVAEQSEAGFKTIRAQSTIVRLGEGAARARTLQQPAIDRTLVALKRFAEIIADENASQVRAVATEACRMASNCEEFLNAIKAETGLDFEIVPAREEARLAILASAPLMETERSVMFDIGGGSTEIILLERTPDHILVHDWVSLPIGVVRGRDAMPGGEISQKAFQAMIKESASTMASFFGQNENFFDGPYQVIGSSGTVTSLAAMVLGLEVYRRDQVDGAVLKTSDMIACAEKMAGTPLADRIAHGVIGPERAEFMVPGCAIFSAIFSFITCEAITAADRGLREGILNSMLARAPDVVFSGQDG